VGEHFSYKFFDVQVDVEVRGRSKMSLKFHRESVLLVFNCPAWWNLLTVHCFFVEPRESNAVLNRLLEETGSMVRQ
jgi:hypothetical protein